MRHRRLTGTLAFCAALAVIGISATAPLPGEAAPARADDMDGAYGIEVDGVEADRAAGAVLDRSDGAEVPPEPVYSVERDSVAESGILGPRTRITVANLTVRPGQYIVSYTFEARLQSSGEPDGLVCGVIDSNGRPRFLIQDQEPIYPGRDWERRSFAASFSLPDMTLGLRCVPVGTGLATASFRDIQLAVTQMDTDG